MEAFAALGVTADPGRVHTEGRLVRDSLEEARAQVAALLGARPRQVVFTSGGTEAVNAAVYGVLTSDPGPVLCAGVEHSAVRDASARQAPVVPVAVDRVGRIEPAALAEAEARCRHEHGRAPALVHCQWANHEVGTVQPVAEAVAWCQERALPVHVDAVAAAGHLPVDVETLGADLLSVSAHKLGGPPGAGALVLRRGLRLPPLLVGGEQERARRAGMENVPAAVGFGAAADTLAGSRRLETESARDRARTERLLAVLRATPGVVPYGDTVDRLPHIVCVGVEGVEAEPVLLGLDQAGVAVHSGSSCSSESLEPSPVLAAMGVDAERSLRISVGWSTSDDDVEACATAFGPVVAGLRALRS